MKTVRLVRLHCYRCVYTWTPVHIPVKICPRCKSRLWDVPKLRPVRLGSGLGSGLGIEQIILPRRREILRIAKKHGVRHLRVFGSVRRSEADRRSDVDFLVTFARGVPPLSALDLKVELGELLDRPVDIAQERTLPWFVKPYALAEALPV